VAELRWASYRVTRTPEPMLPGPTEDA
jgi:hypothetical protein